jgi:hypothetical protein
MSFNASEGPLEEELVPNLFGEVKALITVVIEFALRFEDGRTVFARAAELHFLHWEVGALHLA